ESELGRRENASEAFFRARPPRSSEKNGALRAGKEGEGGPEELEGERHDTFKEVALCSKRKKQR
ncbi:MAG TPA: hypothetical protein PK393_12145, partial [Synergistaceae bacterium]|nr:hypothetical protein [Synergistaceae bacterium]